MTPRVKAVLIGLGAGLAAVASAFIPGWPESGLGPIVFWPVYLMMRVFPPPCFDRGPGQAPFCEGTPMQLFAALFGFAIVFAFYATLGGVVSWRLLRPKLP